MMFLAAPGTHIVIFIEAVLGEELDAIELIQALAADKSTVLGFDFFLTNMVASVFVIPTKGRRRWL